MAMLDKNVVQLKKFKGGKTERFPVSSDKDVIKVAAWLGPIDLYGLYGVPEGLAEMMDVAAQVAVLHANIHLLEAGETDKISSWMRQRGRF
mmetsp:Transcript_27618/g.66519  ORF Transcript_27618/g.66519 Transcript_27618/m.66519 type:complete len:91 (+) Transcript_27618:169-441(+)